MTEKSDAGSGPRVGRPRDPAIDQAIIVAARKRLIEDGYSRMKLADVASDAGVTRPTIYRRWAGKLELVMEALDWGFAAQRDMHPTDDLVDLPPRDALVEALRRLDPCYFNPDAMVLLGNFMGEVNRTPELLAMISEHAVEPRVRLLEKVLDHLVDQGHVRTDIDVRTVATMCFGSYFAAFLRNDDDVRHLAERLGDTLWGLISETPPARSDQ